ncbi:MAG: DSBA-like thioredoxin protein [Myxococcales bacterium]|nr:DSBA-like thioredoxin protein [Myxococcales bacterium]
MRGLCLAVLLVATIARADGNISQTTADHLSFDPKTVYKVPRGEGPSEGPADAPITIVVWSDYACGYCNRVQDTLDRLNRLYPGRIRWVHRTLPLDDDDTVAAEAVLAAAAQGRFLPMHARMFALHGHVDRTDVELVARELGLDMLQFRADLDTHARRPQVAADIADARQLGVTGTPTFFVNGRPVHGSQPLKVFVDMVDEELARAERTHGSYDALVGDGKLTADAPSTASNEAGELDPAQGYRVGLGIPGHQLGPDDALVTIVEFSDFQCPYCAREAAVLAHVRQKYGDQVRIVFRHFPVLFHRYSVIAAEAGAAAAAQGKFWAFHDQVFGHFGALTRGDLEKYAEAAGLDLAKFRAALDDRWFHDAVIAEGAAAEALGVDGTPTLFVNAQPIVGARDATTMDRIIDAHLDHAKAAVAHGLPRSDVYPVMMTMAQGADRADPSAIPEVSVAHIELRAEDRERAVAAACRRRDRVRATALAGALTGDLRKRAFAVCAGEGIDLH